MGGTKIKLAVLISGDGSNLQALIDACAADDYPAEIALVISNRIDAYGVKRARNAGLETAVIEHKNYASRSDFDAAIADALQPYDIDLICLAGFMRILTPDFINAWKDRIINTHPTLLPRHGGEGMYGMRAHEAVIKSGDSQSGVTIHYVIPEVDKGAIILQRSVDVAQDDTAETLAVKVLAQEHIAYPEAVKQVAEKLLN